MDENRGINSALYQMTINKIFSIWYGEAKLMQHFGKFKEAAEQCNHILIVVETDFPEGFSRNYFVSCDSQEILSLAVELLPELWKLADCPKEAIMSYRRALHKKWDLDDDTVTRIAKQFAIYLLYSGYDAEPVDRYFSRPNMESLYVPRNNMEEAVLILMNQFRFSNIGMNKWDPSVRDHLSFALSLSGDLKTLSKQFEEFTLGIDTEETFYSRALCYHGVGDDEAALGLLRHLLRKQQCKKCVSYLLLASKICGKMSENPTLWAREGVKFAHRVLDLQCGCDQIVSAANWLLGVSLSIEASLTVLESERTMKQYEAHMALQTAKAIAKEGDPKVIFHLSLVNAEQRRVNTAVLYARQFLDLEAHSNIKGWILLARLLSAQKRYKDAEAVIDTGLDETGELEKGDLLRTKAKLQIVQGQLQNVVDTYVHLLAVLEVREDYRIGKKLQKDSKKDDIRLEMDVWHDMAIIYYARMSMWQDAEVCLSILYTISCCDAFKFHTRGLLYEAKGLHKEALRAFSDALTYKSDHIPSLVPLSALRRKLGYSSLETRDYLSKALELEYDNSSAWYNLGLLCEDAGTASEAEEAARCYQIAAFLQDVEPVEPFRSPPLHIY